MDMAKAESPPSLPQNLLMPSSIRTDLVPLVGEVSKLLATLNIGHFPTADLADLHSYVVTTDVFRNFKARQKLYSAVASCPSLLSIYEDVIVNAVIPHIKEVGSLPTPTTYWYQYPPSLRLQPGPSPHHGKVSCGRKAETGSAPSLTPQPQRPITTLFMATRMGK